MPEDKEFELDDLDSFSFEELSLEGEEEGTGVLSTPSSDDQYGVWVKGSVDEKQDPTPQLADADFLSSEELAKLDDQFDFVNISEEPLDGESPTDELEDLMPLSPEEEPPSAIPSSADATESFDEISLDDFVDFNEDEEVANPNVDTFETPALEPDSEDEFLDIDIEIEDEIDDHELEILEGAQVKREESEKVEEIQGAEEIDLSEFGDFAEEEPSLDIFAEAVSPDDFLVDIETEPVSETPEKKSESKENKEEPEKIEPIVEEEFSMGDMPLESGEFLEGDSGQFVETLLVDAKDEMDMDHIIALENDLTSGIKPDTEALPEAKTHDSTPEPITSGTPGEDLTSRVLLKIESELSSIKQELTDLKKELSSIRALPAQEPAPVQEEALPKTRHGFFEEEDDDTIALTGDELDNIFSTAEISETELSGESLEDWDDLIQMNADGAPIATEPSAEPAPTTDDDFLSGTSLESNDFDVSELPAAESTFPLPGESQAAGIPDSIELEETTTSEDLPVAMDEAETENLFQNVEEIEQVSNETFEIESPVLEIPFDEEVDLEEEVKKTDEGQSEEDFESAQVEIPSLENLQETEFEQLPLSDEPEFSLASSPMVPSGSLNEIPSPPPVTNPSEATLKPQEISSPLKEELKVVLSYMDRLLASLPDEKIQEFAESEHFEVYKRLFEELGLIE